MGVMQVRECATWCVKRRRNDSLHSLPFLVRLSPRSRWHPSASLDSPTAFTPSCGV
jgi:hypothetical protein